MNPTPPDPQAPVALESSRASDGALVVKLSGELDLANAPEVASRLEHLVETDMAVVFDLEAMDFIDSSGIAVLVTTAAAARTVRVRNPSPIVRRIIDATGLSEVLTIE